jgi:hypothetical protein
MNRTLNERNFTVIKSKVELFLAVSVAAAGAVTLQKWNYPTLGTGGRVYSAAATGAGTSWPSQYQGGTEGVKSVARTAAGLWTVTLQDGYQRLVGLGVYSSLAGGLSTIVAVHENTTITNMTAAGGSIIGLTLLSSTGTAADPASGERVNLILTLQGASEP